MNWFLALVAIVASVELTSAKVIYCYYGSWAKDRNGPGKFTINDINPHLCTHVAWSFVEVKSNGEFNLNGFNEDFKNFLNLKKKNHNVKLTISIGGWSQGSTILSELTNNGGKRERLVNNIYKFITEHHLDGVDIDWEYPAQRGGRKSDKESYVAFLRQLHEKLHKKKLILTAAVEGDVESESYNVREMDKYLDYFNIMTYDYVDGSDGKTGFNSPLNALEKSIKQWLHAGASPHKVLAGVAFYGHSFTLKESSQHGVGARSKKAGKAGKYTEEPGTLEYFEICEELRQGGWHTQWDGKAECPYSYKGNQWVGYDNPKSLEAKCNFVKKNNLAGVIIWSIEGDDLHNACREGSLPLLNALHRSCH